MVQVVTGDSQEEVMIFRDTHTLHHNIYIIFILIILMLPGRPQHFCWWGPPCSGKHSAGPSLPHSWKESLCQFGYYLELDIFWDLDVFGVSIGYFRRALPSSLLETEFML